jgi:hypothetical protein
MRERLSHDPDLAVDRGHAGRIAVGRGPAVRADRCITRDRRRRCHARQPDDNARDDGRQLSSKAPRAESPFCTGLGRCVEILDHRFNYKTSGVTVPDG